LSEPFAIIRLGALAQTEVRLLVEAYLDDDQIVFTPAELRQLIELSAAHPAYVQRAAYHLYQSKLDPSIDWRASYLLEARERPIPGAPLPPAIFEGRRQDQVAQSSYGEMSSEQPPSGPIQLPLPDAAPILILLAALFLALLAYLLSGSLLLASVAAIVGATLAGLWSRLRCRL